MRRTDRTARAERAAFEGARRACCAGLDSVALRAELIRRTAAVLPADAYAFSVTDPELGLLMHSVGAGLPAATAHAFITEAYPDEAPRLLELSRSGPAVSTASSALSRAVIGEAGLTHDLRALLSDGDALWGVWCLMRGRRSPPFDEREQRLLRRLAPHVTRGLRRALARDAARQPDAAGRAMGPGVVVYDARTRPVLRDGAAARYLEDLSDAGYEPDVVPHAVAAALTRLRWRHLAFVARDAEHADAPLLVQGRSGRWYRVHASLAEPDAAGESRAVVVITPATRPETTGALARLYGLSPRERAVLSHLVRGASTKAIAAALGVSSHTVEDFIERACAKVGVRGRKALVAKLCLDLAAARGLERGRDDAPDPDTGRETASPPAGRLA